jgi:HEAT repeats
MPAIRHVCLTVLVFLVAQVAFAQEEKKPADNGDKKIKLKRLDQSTDEDLRKQLLHVPEVGFDQSGAAFLYASMKGTPGTGKVRPGTDKSPPAPPDVGQRVYTQLATKNKRLDWLALPWRKGEDCQLGKETAERLHVFSTNLRLLMIQSKPQNDVRPDHDKLRDAMAGKGFGLRPRGEKPLEWNKADALPTLTQMLQTESTDIRRLMIETYAKIDGKDASMAIARRAIFDLSPELREKAIEALAARPAKEYQQVLIDALRWPRAPAAEHAAEALAALEIKSAVPDLVHLLKEPDPKLAYHSEVKTEKAPMIREVVRLNHLSNCVLCHALSGSKDDLVRGVVPVPGVDPPPQYYQAQTGTFVRADTTYLKQDFSVIQPVKDPGKWSGFQRFDYLVRTRKATPAEIKLLTTATKEKKLNDPYPQRDAVLFALREITKMDRGSQHENWAPLLDAVRKEEESKEKK